MAINPFSQASLATKEAFDAYMVNRNNQTRTANIAANPELKYTQAQPKAFFKAGLDGSVDTQSYSAKAQVGRLQPEDKVGVVYTNPGDKQPTGVRYAKVQGYGRDTATNGLPVSSLETEAIPFSSFTPQEQAFILSKTNPKNNSYEKTDAQNQFFNPNAIGYGDSPVPNQRGSLPFVKSNLKNPQYSDTTMAGIDKVLVNGEYRDIRWVNAGRNNQGVQPYIFDKNSTAKVHLSEVVSPQQYQDVMAGVNVPQYMNEGTYKRFLKTSPNLNNYDEIRPTDATGKYQLVKRNTIADGEFILPNRGELQGLGLELKSIDDLQKEALRNRSSDSIPVYWGSPDEPGKDAIDAVARAGGSGTWVEDRQQPYLNYFSANKQSQGASMTAADLARGGTWQSGRNQPSAALPDLTQEDFISDRMAYSQGGYPVDVPRNVVKRQHLERMDSDEVNLLRGNFLDGNKINLNLLAANPLFALSETVNNTLTQKGQNRIVLDPGFNYGLNDNTHYVPKGVTALTPASEFLEPTPQRTISNIDRSNDAEIQQQSAYIEADNFDKLKRQYDEDRYYTKNKARNEIISNLDSVDASFLQAKEQLFNDRVNALNLPRRANLGDYYNHSQKQALNSIAPYDQVRENIINSPDVIRFPTTPETPLTLAAVNDYGVAEYPGNPDNAYHYPDNYQGRRIASLSVQRNNGTLDPTQLSSRGRWMGGGIQPSPRYKSRDQTLYDPLEPSYLKIETPKGGSYLRLRSDTDTLTLESQAVDKVARDAAAQYQEPPQVNPFTRQYSITQTGNEIAPVIPSGQIQGVTLPVMHEERIPGGVMSEPEFMPYTPSVAPLDTVTGDSSKYLDPETIAELQQYQSLIKSKDADDLSYAREIGRSLQKKGIPTNLTPAVDNSKQTLLDQHLADVRVGIDGAKYPLTPEATATEYLPSTNQLSAEKTQLHSRTRVGLDDKVQWWNQDGPSDAELGAIARDGELNFNPADDITNIRKSGKGLASAYADPSIAPTDIVSAIEAKKQELNRTNALLTNYQTSPTANSPVYQDNNFTGSTIKYTNQAGLEQVVPANYFNKRKTITAADGTTHEEDVDYVNQKDLLDIFDSTRRMNPAELQARAEHLQSEIGNATNAYSQLMGIEPAPEIQITTTTGKRRAANLAEQMQQAGLNLQESEPGITVGTGSLPIGLPSERSVSLPVKYNSQEVIDPEVQTMVDTGRATQQIVDMGNTYRGSLGLLQPQSNAQLLSNFKQVVQPDGTIKIVDTRPDPAINNAGYEVKSSNKFDPTFYRDKPLLIPASSEAALSQLLETPPADTAARRSFNVNSLLSSQPAQRPPTQQDYDQSYTVQPSQRSIQYASPQKEQYIPSQLAPTPTGLPEPQYVTADNFNAQSPTPNAQYQIPNWALPTAGGVYLAAAGINEYQRQQEQKRQQDEAGLKKLYGG